MKIVELTTTSLVPYEKNARIHSAEQIEDIAHSIKKFGFNNPVLIDKENQIIAGHGRVDAAKLLGLKKVPCIYLDHLTKEEARAYVLADNQIALGSEWDESLLEAELNAIYKSDDSLVGLLGFSDDLLDEVIDIFETPKTEKRKTESVDDVFEVDEDDYEEETPQQEFKPQLPKDDEDEIETQKEFILKVSFENDDDRQELFVELRDRGFKVKV